MKSIRIEHVLTIGVETIFAVDVVCDCGGNGLKDMATKENSFKHRISTADREDKILVCHCGKKYHLHPQTGHIHVQDE